MRKHANMNHKLLVLGSDYSTLQVVKQAKKDGIYVIVADLMESSPTKSEADENWHISTTNIDLLERKCKEEKVTAIMFGASDFNIDNSRKLCHKLGLPIYCENDVAWTVAQDKRLFKDICKKVGAPVAEDYILTDSLSKDDLKHVKYPVVVKPADKSGNRGMSYCDNEYQLIEAYKYARSMSPQRPVIVERRLCGSEYNVHYVLAEGKAKILYFNATHHQPGVCDNLYSFKCTTRAHLKQYLETVNEKIIKVLQEAGCTEGIAWVDVMRDNDGRFYALEMGYRFGGVMTYIPYEKISGFNTIKWMMECALGIKHKKEHLPDIFTFKQDECAASYHLFTCNDGTISKIVGLNEIEKIEGVWVDMPKREGCTVRDKACMGLVGIYAKNSIELCEKLSRINDALKILDQDGKNMFIQYNDYNTIKEEYEISQKEFG